MNIDEFCPKLTELEISVAIDTCRKAGAVNAGTALSKHITRMQIELAEMTNKYNDLSSEYQAFCTNQ